MWSILTEGIHLYDMRLVIEFLGVIIGIYVACVIIDAIRRQLFKIVNNISVGNKIDMFLKICLLIKCLTFNSTYSWR